jgi:hypothetical protein
MQTRGYFTTQWYIYAGGEGRNTVNPYVHFGQPDIWPRGYPLDAIEFKEQELRYLRSYIRVSEALR